MKAIFLLLSSLFFVQINCLAQNDLDERDKQDYREIISLYPKYLVSHFPDNIDDKEKVAFMSLSFPRGRYLSYIHLALPLENKQLEQLEKSIAKKAKMIYHHQDSCLIIPYNYKIFKVIESDSIRNIPFVKMLPITNFCSWNLPLDFYEEVTIYLLDAKKGHFLQNDCLTKSGVGLPKEWIHGYTKGVAFWRKFVFYWLEVW